VNIYVARFQEMVVDFPTVSKPELQERPRQWWKRRWARWAERSTGLYSLQGNNKGHRL